MKGREAASRPSDAAWAAPIALLGVIVLAVVGWPRPERGRPAAPLPDSPFAAVATSCPEGVAPAFGAQADERRARVMLARHPFDQGEGVRAVGLLLRSAACYRAAGNEVDAGRARADAAAWRTELDREYRSFLLQMRLALAQQRPAEALSAVRALSRFLADAGGEPVSTLKGHERRLEREARKRKEER